MEPSEHYSIFVSIVIFGWLPVVMYIFWTLPTQRAIVVAFVVAWLFLPMALFKIQGIPAYTKMSATCCGILLAAIVFDSKKMLNLSFFPSYVDIPMVIWCLCPLATVAATSNDTVLTLHDGFSWMFEQIVDWGLPYLIGRIYMSNKNAMRELGIAVFVGGLVYVPFCLWEIRMSPQLHYMVYGFHQHSVTQQARGDTFRPMVFMQHGLAVSMYMITACVLGMMFWKMGTLKRLWGYSVGWLLVPLIGTTILCRSMGATVLMVVGTVFLWICLRTRTSIAVWILIIGPSVYVSARTIWNWDAESSSALMSTVSDKERQHSLMFRLENEKYINQRTEKHDVWFGWGGYFRAFWLATPDGPEVFTPDSLWISAFGTWGATGLIALLLLTFPILLLLHRLPREAWKDPSMAGVLAFCVLLGLFQIDNMVNSMPNPIFLLALGGLCGLAKGKNITVGKSTLDTDYFVRQAARRSLLAAEPA